MMVLVVATAEASLAALRARSRLGIAKAAKTSIALAPAPPRLLAPRIAVSSPYAQTTIGVVADTKREMLSVISGDTCFIRRAIIAIGSSYSSPEASVECPCGRDDINFGDFARDSPFLWRRT